MTNRFLDRDEVRAFYDRFGSKQDWQRIYEGGAIRRLLRQGGLAPPPPFSSWDAVLERSPCCS